METFDFSLDTKVTTWYRTKFEIEANSEEEAKQIAIDFVKSGETSDISWEQIDDTIEVMSVTENDGQPTGELFLEPSQDLIWSNGTE